MSEKTLKRKRGKKGEGSVYRLKSGSWCWRVPTGRKDGNTIYKSVYGDTLEDVTAKADEVKALVKKRKATIGSVQDPESDTFLNHLTDEKIRIDPIENLLLLFVEQLQKETEQKIANEKLAIDKRAADKKLAIDKRAEERGLMFDKLKKILEDK